MPSIPTRGLRCFHDFVIVFGIYQILSGRIEEPFVMTVKNNCEK